MPSPRRDGGFGVVEVLVALSLLGVVAAAVLPVLVLSGKASTIARDRTQAKNLANERLESLRSLSFHVARQNQPGGAATDLLDLYYPSAVAAAGPLATTTTYVAPSTTGRPADEPQSGAYFRTHTASLSGAPRYSETVTVQLLEQAVSGTTAPVTPSAAYSATTVGADAPPSRLADVRVLVRWSYAGQTQTVRLTSRMADAGNARVSSGSTGTGTSTGQALVSQAKATALSVLNTATSNEIYLRLGAATADGAAGTSSSAAASGEAATVGNTGGVDIDGAVSSVGAPPDGTVAAKTGPAWNNNAWCDVGCFGPSRNGAMTAGVVDGLPTVGGSPGPSAGNPVVSALPRRGTCAATPCLRTTKPLAFSGYLYSDSALHLDYNSNNGSSPKTHGAVTLEDPASGDAAVGRAFVTATSGTTRSVTASASASQPAVLGLLPTTRSIAAGAGGLVRIVLDSASLSCTAGASGPSATAAYKGTLWYYGKLGNGTFGYTAVPFERTAAGVVTGGALPAFNTVVVAEVTTGPNQGVWYLSQYLESVAFGTPSVTADTASGSVRANLSAVKVVTRSLDTSSTNSSYNIDVAALSCVAVDAR